jgi:transcriptional regulator with XRE-family HTH domain
MNWKEHKKKLLEDPEFRKEYEALEPEYKLASTLIRLRLAKGLTQEQLAKLLNTKQESIARLESGGSLPSLSTIRKVADALDAEVEISLRPKCAIWVAAIKPDVFSPAVDVKPKCQA